MTRSARHKIAVVALTYCTARAPIVHSRRRWPATGPRGVARRLRLGHGESRLESLQLGVQPAIDRVVPPAGVAHDQDVRGVSLQHEPPRTGAGVAVSCSTKGLNTPSRRWLFTSQLTASRCPRGRGAGPPGRRNVGAPRNWRKSAGYRRRGAQSGARRRSPRPPCTPDSSARSWPRPARAARRIAS